MANTLLAYDNLADGAALTGGAWVTTLPLDNLRNRVIGRVARSSDADPASTQFDVDLQNSKVFRVVALAGHNFSLTARYRIRGGSDPDFATTTFDSGWTDVWPTLYGPLELEWEAENFWTGKYTEAQRRGYNWTLVYILPATALARRIRVEIEDEDNAAGYVQAGRLFVADAWSPEYNVGVGQAAQGWEDESLVQRALSGAEYFDSRTRRRIARFGWELLTEAEAMQAFDIMRLVGVTGEVLYIHDPDDVEHRLRRQFLGRIRQLGAIEYPRVSSHPNATAFEISELL